MSIPVFKNVENPRIDLHSHTTFSDGKLTPVEIIDRAVNFQIDVLAITDHDTVAGLEQAKQHIENNNLALTLINGIEISTLWNGFDIHIVGLNINPSNPALVSFIEKQQIARETRATEMGKKLEKAGFTGIYQAAKLLAGDGSVTRAHFARVLMAQGHISKMQAAFDKYIGKGKRAFVKPNWCSMEEAVSIIHQAGGVAVMAHPIRYDLSGKWRRKLIVEFKEACGDGLEIILPQMNPEQKKLMLSYCQEYELYASLGSDFHFPTKWNDLGRNLRLPENCQPVWQLW
jgi:predicted metal-dependent phosphoesterase TrpH